MGRTNSPEPLKPGPITMPTSVSIDSDELARLHKIESAALKVVGSMYRRGGKVSSPSLTTFEALVELGECFEEEENDGTSTTD